MTATTGLHRALAATMLALLLAALSPPPAAAQVPSCPDPAAGQDFARPTPRSAFDLVYSPGADLVRIGSGPAWPRHDASGGDDTIFLVDPPAGATVAAGNGSDRVIVCSMPDLSLLVMLSDMEAWDAGDAEPDLLVIEPAVFLGLPPGIERQIEVQGLNPQNDRILLRLPPGVGVSYTPSPFVTARAGAVAIHVTPSGATMPVGAEVFLTEAAAAPAVPAVPILPPLARYDPAAGCEQGAGLAASSVASLGDGVVAYGAGEVVHRIDPGPEFQITGDADETIFSFAAGQIGAEGGADTIFVCALPAPSVGIALGSGSVGALDLAPDTVVIEAGRLQGSGPVQVGIINLTPSNDRIVLRVPPGLEARLMTDAAGWTHAEIGVLRVTVLAQDWARGLAVGPEVFVIERVAAPAPLPDVPLASPPVAAAQPDRLVCGGAVAADARLGSVSDWRPDGLVFADGPQDLRLGPLPGIAEITLSDGNDLVEFYDPRPGTHVGAGGGADIVVLCRLVGLGLSVGLGTQTPDGDADLLVLGPDALAGIPAGLERRLEIYGLDPADRIALRLPAGVQPVAVPDERGAYQVGPLRLWIEADEDLLATGRLFFETDPEVALAAGPPLVPPSLAADFGCDDPRAAAAPLAEAHRDAPMLLYGPAADFVRVGPGEILTWELSDGDDRVLVAAPPPSARVHLGPGADTARICAMTDLGINVDFGRADAEPDLLVVEPAVFAGVPPGFTRQIVVWSAEPANDRVLLRLPPGLALSEVKRSRDDTARFVAGDVEILVFARRPPAAAVVTTE